MRKTYQLEDLDCAVCAEKMEKAAAILRESHLAKTVFATETYNREGGFANDK